MITVSKETISKAKTSNNIIEVLQECGIKLIKENNHFKAICPFHEDKEPSLKVDPQKQVYNCFGCGNGGDIIKFLIDYKKIEFKDAVNFLLRRAGLPELIIDNEQLTITKKNLNHKPIIETHQTTENGKLQNTETQSPPTTANEKKEMTEAERVSLLNRVVEFYHQKFLESEKAQNYLFLTRKIKNKNLANLYKIGFCDGSLMKTIETQPEYKTQLVTLGVIKQNEKTKQYFEAFKNCIVFPIFDEENNCVNIYGRKIIDGEIKHLYLSGSNKGVFNWQAVKQNDAIIITECIIDAFSFIDSGVENVVSLYGKNSSPKEMLQLFKQYKTKKIYFALDNDNDGNNTQIKLTELFSNELPNANLYKINIPNAKDINDYYCLNIDKTQCLSDLIKNNCEALRIIKPLKEKVEITYADKYIVIKIKDIIYKIKGFSIADQQRYQTQLKINLRTIYDNNNYIDTIDLYSAKSRETYKKDCAEELGILEETIKDDLKIIIQNLEEMLESKQFSASAKEYEMTESEKNEALEFLKSRNLFKIILDDFETGGYIGEETNKLAGYLAAVSRKLLEPLSIMIMSRSAGGKSTLLDHVLSFMPPEEYIKYTSVTGQALYYKDENSMVNKLLAIAEEEGAEKATYSLKTFQSDKELNIASTGKDPVSGKLKTFDYKVKGPVSLFLTTTAAEINYELLNRFIVLTVDEGKIQTNNIQDQQRNSFTLEGIIKQKKNDTVIRKHQNAQRLLKPLAVAIPYAKYLSYGDEQLRARRDNKKYLNIICSIAFLHQYQREIKKYQSGNIMFDYINADLDDLEEANKLAEKILIHTLDELAPPSRDLLKIINEMTEKQRKNKEKEKNKNDDPISFTRREIRENSRWSDFQIRTHIKQLEDFEYIQILSGNQGKKYSYQLIYEGSYGNKPTIKLTSKAEVLEKMRLEKELEKASKN
ncbi:toprim domain-containing protein [Candidatus Dependentiae bacterium]|nr:toprim domain-containing protein [Candidatus Dependentiae bacterium]